jgi:hypothetical protein
MKAIQVESPGFSCTSQCVTENPGICGNGGGYCIADEECLCDYDGGFSPFLDDLLEQDDGDASRTNGSPHGKDICDAFAIKHGIRSEFCPYNYVGAVTVENSIGEAVAFFDSGGNVVLEGTLTEDTTPTPDGGTDEFILRDSSNNVMAVVDVGGDMAIKGSLNENEDSLSPSGGDDFIIRNGEDTVVSYVDQDGHLYLVGHCYEDIDIP